MLDCCFPPHERVVRSGIREHFDSCRTHTKRAKAFVILMIVLAVLGILGFTKVIPLPQAVSITFVSVAGVGLTCFICKKRRDDSLNPHPPSSSGNTTNGRKKTPEQHAEQRARVQRSERPTFGWEAAGAKEAFDSQEPDPQDG